MTAQPHILILGNTNSREMQAVCTTVETHIAQDQLRQALDTEAASRLAAEENWFPDLVVVCQNWPDEFTSSEVHKMMTLFPLARWICCFGVWCESDGRNKDIWPLAARIPARNAKQRVLQELALLKGTRQVLPLTASRDETFEFDCDDPIPHLPGVSVSVNSPDIEYRLTLEEVLTAAGCHVLKSSDASASEILLWDLDPWSDERADALRNFSDEAPEIKIIALMTFAHPETITEVTLHGAAVVLPKLASCVMLLEELKKYTPTKIEK